MSAGIVKTEQAENKQGLENYLVNGRKPMLLITLRVFLLLLLTNSLLILSLRSESVAEDEVLAVHKQLPCLGYDPATSRWAKQVIPVRTEKEVYDYFVCPKNMAILSVFKQAMKPLAAKYIGIDANCCPLPATDILLDEHIQAEAECPEDYVATGARLPRYGDRIPRPLRCTRINTRRYQLGRPMKARYWGAGGSGAFSIQEPERIQIKSIPMSIRFGVVRYSETRNFFSGCIGAQGHELLVAKQSKRCSGHIFKELQYRGVANDPDKGSPVVMAPECARISNIFDAQAVCLKN